MEPLNSTPTRAILPYHRRDRRQHTAHFCIFVSPTPTAYRGHARNKDGDTHNNLLLLLLCGFAVYFHCGYRFAGGILFYKFKFCLKAGISYAEIHRKCIYLRTCSGTLYQKIIMPLLTNFKRRNSSFLFQQPAELKTSVHFNK